MTCSMSVLFRHNNKGTTDKSLINWTSLKLKIALQKSMSREQKTSHSMVVDICKRHI